jgi:hypothetical protein
VVTSSTADLAGVSAALPRTVGTSWGIDTKSNQVVVTIT